jgi:hypothetical protein
MGVTVDPVHQGTFYVGGASVAGGAPVHRSIDGGATCTTFDDGLVAPVVTALAIDGKASHLHGGT